MSHKILLTALLGAFSAIPAASFAVPIVTSFSCPVDTGTCNGNEYGWAVEGVDSDTWQISVAVHVTDGYTGNQWTDSLNSIALKSFTGSAFSNLSLVAAPTSVMDWAISSKELNANGCAGGTTPSSCIEWNIAGNGVGFTSGDILSWTFQFDSAGPITSDAHLKYLYIDSDGNKIGSLGSFDIPSSTTTTRTVPEPGSLLLLGGGLLALGVGRRRFRRGA